MKKIILLIGMLMLVGILILANMFYKCSKASEELVFQDVELQQLQDGIYSGVCDLVFVKVELSITIKNHKIMDTTLLKHDNGMGSNAEILIKQMKEENTINLDIISGATISSKAIKKAAENALLEI